jgi:hypothetical protein
MNTKRNMSRFSVLDLRKSARPELVLREPFFCCLFPFRYAIIMHRKDKRNFSCLNLTQSLIKNKSWL